MCRAALLEYHIVTSYPLGVGFGVVGTVRVHIVMGETQSPIVDRKLDVHHPASHARREVASGRRIRRFVIYLDIELTVGKLSSNIQCTI